jgi:hypothetical protein
MEIAEIIGKLNAYLIANGLPIEYQMWLLLLLSFVKGDWLLTEIKNILI